MAGQSDAVYLVVIGGFLAACGSLAYTRATLTGRVRPNRVSYLLWSVAPMVMYAAQRDAGVGAVSLVTLCAACLPLLTLLASLSNPLAHWALTRFDVACGFASVLGLGVWIGTRDNELAILVSIVADALAAIPTVLKSYRHPHTELAWPSLAAGVGAGLAMLSVSQWTFAAIGFLGYLVGLNLLLYTIIQFRLGLVLAGSGRHVAASNGRFSGRHARVSP